jgi:hypothetical protein
VSIRQSSITDTKTSIRSRRAKANHSSMAHAGLSVESSYEEIREYIHSIQRTGFCTGNQIGTYQERDLELEAHLKYLLPKRPKEAHEGKEILAALREYEETKDADFAYKDHIGGSIASQGAHHVYYCHNKVRRNNMQIVAVSDLQAPVWYDITYNTKYTKLASKQPDEGPDENGVMYGTRPHTTAKVAVKRQEVVPLWSVKDTRCVNDNTHCFQVTWDGCGSQWIVKSAREKEACPGVVLPQFSAHRDNVGSVLGSGITYMCTSTDAQAAKLTVQSLVMVRYVHFPERVLEPYIM